jgi:hypothetical protein
MHSTRDAKSRHEKTPLAVSLTIYGAQTQRYLPIGDLESEEYEIA